MIEGNVIEKLRAELRDKVMDDLKAEMRAAPGIVSDIKNRLTEEIYRELRDSIIDSRPDKQAREI